jgi:hypothetical protein
MKLETTAERFDLILPWLNDDDGVMTRAEVRHRLNTFIRSFDGSEGAGYLKAEIEKDDDGPPAWMVKAVARFQDEGHELSVVRSFLRDTLRRGFPKDRHHEEPWFDPAISTSIAFGIERMPTSRGEQARPGEYVMRAVGSRFDLAVFLVMHLLTRGNRVTVGRCPSPMQFSKTKRCGRFFIVTDGQRGRPRRFCEQGACRERDSRRGRKGGKQ